MAEDDTGEEITATAKAVIVATGGFGDNPKMIKKFTGYQHGRDLFSFRIPGVAGDGLRMAWEMGAARSEISMELTFGIPREDVYGFGVRSAFRQPHLMVNLLGERFVNEEVVVNTPFTGNAISRQKDRCAVMILDDAILDHYEKHGLDLPMSLVFNVPMGDVRQGIEQAISSGVEDLIIADGIEELAAKTGIPCDQLKKTLEEYNRHCQEGHDGLFNKDRKYLHPVTGPKFYAGKNYPAGYGSLGGIKINYKTEVLNKDWQTIPGLYAAGIDTCDIFGDCYPFIFPGSTMGYAMNTGRIAGENAADYVKTL
jgi:fumarate reductase flavoprotein subunit